MVPTITDAQRTRLDEQGYFLLSDVFTRDEMQHVIDRIEDAHRKSEESLKAQGGTSGISRAGEILFNDHLAEKDDRIRQFVTRPEWVAITTALLGPDVDLYWNQSVFKEPEGTKEFPWHQDDGYTPVSPSPYLTLWLALNDATPENGCISVLPGGHKQGLLPHENSPIGLVCHSNDDPNQGELVPVNAGGVAVFWSLTPHKSGANRSQGPRKAYVIQYCKAGLVNLRTGETIPNLIPVARGGQAV